MKEGGREEKAREGRFLFICLFFLAEDIRAVFLE